MMPSDSSFVLGALGDEAQWAVIGDAPAMAKAMAVAILKQGLCEKENLSRSWIEPNEVSFAESKSRGDWLRRD